MKLHQLMGTGVKKRNTLLMVKNMKVHIIRRKPYVWIESSTGHVPLYKSLCGIKEPQSQSYGRIVPSCKRCIKIQEGKEKS
jgi:hypothetical protein